MSEQSGSAESDAWDAYFDHSEVARMCPCPSCNFYLPEGEYKPDSECVENTLIKAIVAGARADERERFVAELRTLTSRMQQSYPPARDGGDA